MQYTLLNIFTTIITFVFNKLFRQLLREAFAYSKIAVSVLCTRIPLIGSPKNLFPMGYIKI